MKKDKFVSIVVIICLLTLCFEVGTSLLDSTQFETARAESSLKEITLENEFVENNDDYEIQSIREEFETYYEVDNEEMQILESLMEQFCYYKAMLSRVSDEDVERVQSMIDATKNLIISYYEIKIPNGGISFYDLQGDYVLHVQYVVAAIAWFNTSNYKLSAELLTQAYNKDNYVENYTPINGNIVLSSSVTYNILNGDIIEGTSTYPIYSPSILNKVSRDEEDLGFAIHHFTYKRNSLYNKKISITDRYDFAQQEGDGVLDELVNAIYRAQELGVIQTYDITIDIDLSEPLIFNVLYESGGYMIDIHNNSDKNLTVYYNCKMCNREDAIGWKGLEDVNEIVIKANKSVQVKILENGTATHIVASYIKNAVRIITSASEVTKDNHLNKWLSKVMFPVHLDVNILYKSGNKWKIRIQNTYSYNAKFEYNESMCSLAEATTWTNLNDIVSFYLRPGQYFDITIWENGLAAHIAMRFIVPQLGYEYYIFANNLSADGTMNIGRRSAEYHSYLSLENIGKSGSKWTIRIHNPLYEPITVWYNTKMCNFNDAKNWTGLKHLESIEVQADDYVDVVISEYVFATSVTCSFIYERRRLVTYANELKKDGSISTYTNYL